MLDDLLAREYDSAQYHCVHFVIEAYQRLYDRDISSAFMGLTGEVMTAHEHSRSMIINNRRLHVPSDGCIVLMNSLSNRAHVGIYHHGKVLHMNGRGAAWQDLRQLSRHYYEFKYYAP